MALALQAGLASGGSVELASAHKTFSELLVREKYLLYNLDQNTKASSACFPLV